MPGLLVVSHELIMNLLGPPEHVLSLERIRATLVRLEETIIFCMQTLFELSVRNIHLQRNSWIALIERAQFAHNPKLYIKGGIQELADGGHDGTWLQWFLKETESMHGNVLIKNTFSCKILAG